VLRRSRAIKCKATWQRNEIRVYILLGIKDTVHFFSCRLLIQIEPVCGMPSVDKSTNTSTCLRGNLCAKTYKSCVGSGDSSTRDQPEPSTPLYIVERGLACFVCLCSHPLHWLRLLTLAISIGHCQYSYIFVSCWPSACNLQVMWIKEISFATTALLNTFARALLGLIHWSLSCPLQLSIFSI